MSKRCLFVLAVTLIAICQGQPPVNPCEGEINDLESCLSYIRSVALDTNRFWFGDGFEERCTGSASVECNNLNGYSGRDLLSLMFNEGASALDDLDRFLYVRYESEAFQYSGCGTNVDQPAISFDLDLSLEEHLPATARGLPMINWEYEEGDMFTIMMVDPAANILHGLHTNFEGNDGRTGEELVVYRGPSNPRFTPNPYVWLLFKQPNGPIVWTQEWADMVTAMTFVSSLSQFKDEFGLSGPVAMNIMLMTTDIYAVNRFQSLLPTVFQYCSAFVERALMKQEEEFLPDDVTLQAFLHVTIESEDFEFFYCCEPHFFNGKTTVLDPLGHHLVNAADVRTGSNIYFSLNATGGPPMIDSFKDKYYLIMAVDPDVPYPTAGTTSRPLLHYFAYNMYVEGTSQYTGNVMSGTEARMWRGPAPPDDSTHSYYFLMFEQNDWLVEPDADLAEYTVSDNCPETIQGRCLFDVERYISEKDLKLTAASWMQVRNDQFVDFMRGADEAEVCGDRYPCPTPLPPGGASGLGISIIGMLMLCALAMIFV